jgi:hypothetical protein
VQTERKTKQKQGFVCFPEVQPTFGEAKVRISERKLVRGFIHKGSANRAQKGPDTVSASGPAQTLVNRYHSAIHKLNLFGLRFIAIFKQPKKKSTKKHSRRRIV